MKGTYVLLRLAVRLLYRHFHLKHRPEPHNKFSQPTVRTGWLFYHSPVLYWWWRTCHHEHPVWWCNHQACRTSETRKHKGFHNAWRQHKQSAWLYGTVLPIQRGSMGHDVRSVWLGRMTGSFISVRMIWWDVMTGLYHNKGGKITQCETWPKLTMAWWWKTKALFQWHTEGGVGMFKSPPPKFQRPSKIVPNSTRLWKLLKIAELGCQHRKIFGKKGSKILKLPRFAIVLH